MWVEKVELTAEDDEQVRKWEWDQEAERWSGGLEGGTDPALGLKGRHAVRSAWIAQNWGTGSGASVIGSNPFSGRSSTGAGGLHVVEARLQYARDFLKIAISIAEGKYSSDKLRPQTIVELLTRHAAVLERMGSPDALFESRSKYERVWAGLPGKGIDAARTALKLGDLNHRLGEPDDALAWWARAIQLTQKGGRERAASIPPVVLESAPSSPSAQRILTSALVSLSAFYATSGQLHQAQAVEEASLELLKSIGSLDSQKPSSSPPETLHALYLLQRSSLISIHLAEVLFTQHKPLNTTIKWLSAAAESSERVAFALTGLPLIHPDAPESKIPHPPSSEKSLLPAYSRSHSMRKPASSLLRDARRTAAEAWNLLGILNEEVDSSKPEKALECYERALGWAGVAADKSGGIGEPGEGILESEWNILWGNYVRVRDAVHKRVAKP